MSDSATAVDQSFLGRVFDAYQNMTQIAACIREAARQRSIANPTVLELSRRPTDLADYIPDVRLMRYPTHEDNEPTLDMPVALPFADKSFDCCLITDVYEHVPQAQRPSLLREMLRITDGLVLVAAPHESAVVTRFDRVVFDFIWGKYGERFKPLDQHAAFGLEPLATTLESLKAEGAERVAVLPANYVYRWIHMILIYFDLQHRNDLARLFEPFNRVYNRYLSPYDYREPCYRYVIAIGTHPDIDVDALHAALQQPREQPVLVDDADGQLVRTFREIDAGLADELRRSTRELAELRERHAAVVRESEAREIEAQALRSELAKRRNPARYVLGAAKRRIARLRHRMGRAVGRGPR